MSSVEKEDSLLMEVLSVSYERAKAGSGSRKSGWITVSGVLWSEWFLVTCWTSADVELMFE